MKTIDDFLNLFGYRIKREETYRKIRYIQEAHKNNVSIFWINLFYVMFGKGNNLSTDL